MQNIYIYIKTQKEEEAQTDHTRISQLPYQGQSYNLQRKRKKERKKKAKQQQKKKKKRWENPRTTNCAKYTQAHYSINTFATNVDLSYYTCPFPCIQVHSLFNKTKNKKQLF